MRLVIEEKTPYAFINIQDVNDGSIVGVEFKNGRRCAVINLGCSKYTSIGSDLDASDNWTKESIKEYVQRVIAMQGTSVYVFNASKELFKWMSEEKIK